MGPFCQGSRSAGWGQGCALSNWFPFHVPASPGAFSFVSPWLQHRHGQPAGSALGFAPGDSPLPPQSISPGCIHGVLLLADKELGAHRERLPGVQVRAAIPLPSLSPPQGPLLGDHRQVPTAPGLLPLRVCWAALAGASPITATVWTQVLG